MFKRTLFLFLIICLCSCSDEPASLLWGVWNEAGPKANETFIFKEDGSFSGDSSSLESVGKWSLDGDVDPMLLHMSIYEKDDEDYAEITSTIRFLSPNKIEISGMVFSEKSGHVYKLPPDDKLVFIRQ